MQLSAERRRGRFEQLAGRVTPTALSNELRLLENRLGPLAQRLAPSALRLLDARRQRLDGLDKLLRAYSYKDVLARGFALVTGPDGELVRSPDQVRPGDLLTIELADDNKLAATVTGAAAAPRKKPKPPLEGGGQESLF